MDCTNQERYILKRFPEKYKKPNLISLDEGLHSGWTAGCRPGATAATVAGCSFGETPGKSGGFIDPEIFQQGL